MKENKSFLNIKKGNISAHKTLMFKTIYLNGIIVLPQDSSKNPLPLDKTINFDFPFKNTSYITLSMNLDFPFMLFFFAQDSYEDLKLRCSLPRWEKRKLYRID
jgi:hypothetical protein